MKYLVTGLPGPNPIPREHGAELLELASGWIKSKLMDGTIECHYSLFGGGGMGILNASSHEELMAEMLAYPLYPFFDWDVKPLLDFEDAYRKYIGFYQQITG